MNNRFIIMVLDGFGAGEAPDADKYGDCGSATLQHIYEQTYLELPNMKKLGIFNIDGINLENKEENVIGCYGKAQEKAAGKNSPVGHWEMSGYVNKVAFATYPNGFPEEMIEEFKQKTGLQGTLYNGVGSGTDLLKKYGEEHMKTGYPIVYTSADSVFQIAAHEDIIPVIARPFVGDKAENFTRTYNRKDFETETFGRTMLDVLKENNKKVLAIGKINDLFSGRGIEKSIHTQGNVDGIEKTIEAIKEDNEYKLIYTNLVDFDMLYGHRNNVEGYAKALEYFDSKLPEIMENMKQEDILIITADHGNDPATPSTDHSREYVPILVYGKNLKQNINLGTRKTYADIASTILDMCDLEQLKYGESFKEEIIK